MLRCEPFATVDVSDLVSWIRGIDLADWPQQRRDELRPAMVTDPGWYDFKNKTDGVVNRLMASFPGCLSENRMLSAVMPGHSIEPHRDMQPTNFRCRVHVPLFTNPVSSFVVQGKPYFMEVGTAYAVNTEVKHSVTNEGDTPRIHFMFDVRTPNA